MKTVVHMIGQAHLDPAWLWRWVEGRAEALATSRSAVDRLHEYPDFQFVRGEAQVYQWIEQEDAELFAEILDLIHQGRWHVVNGMIVQPDVNLPQGEALVRQMLLGKRYMRERLGFEPRVAYCVDSFGHPGTMPQILKKCGFDTYVFMRPGPHEKTLPAEVFWWQGPDGSCVLAFRIAAAYTTRGEDQAAHIEAAVQAKPALLSHTMCFFGLGDHGGGPTKQQIENVQALARVRADLEIRFSSPEAYFEAIGPQAGGLPTVVDELHCHAVGCYSVNSALKRTYRQAECGLLTAERMAALAQALLGKSAPLTRLDALWHDLCFNQFHDVLCGTCVKEAQDEAIRALGRIALGSQEIVNDAGRAISAAIDTSGVEHPSRPPLQGQREGGTVVLFNPGAEPVTQYVEYEPWTDWQPWEAGKWGLTVEEGGHSVPVPHQLIHTHEALSSDVDSLNRIVFRAAVPAMGYRIYRFAPNAPRVQVTGEASVTTDVQMTGEMPSRSKTHHVLENERLLLRLDSISGNMISCLDKASGLELIGPGGWNVAQVLEDTSDTWSHGAHGFGKVIARFEGARVSVLEEGPLQASLLIERSHNGNTWIQQVVLRQAEDGILVRNWLSWQGRFRMLKLAFDVPTDAPQAAHDVPFGWCCRPCDGHEVPTQMWMDVSGPLRKTGFWGGLALINDGKYGCDVTGSVMRLTILRCPPYAYHLPHRFGSKPRYDWVDQGEQEFELLLQPHVGDWRDAAIVKRAREFNQPLIPITMHSHRGRTDLSRSLLDLSSQEIELTAFKPAQDGDGYILRLADRHGRGGTGELRWLAESFSVGVMPFEVITLRITQRGERWQMIPCDMLERQLSA